MNYSIIHPKSLVSFSRETDACEEKKDSQVVTEPLEHQNRHFIYITGKARAWDQECCGIFRLQESSIRFVILVNE